MDTKPLTQSEIEELRKQCHSRELKHGGRGLAQVWVPTRSILALLSMLPSPQPAQPAQPGDVAEAVERAETWLGADPMSDSMDWPTMGIDLCAILTALRRLEVENAGLKSAVEFHQRNALGACDCADTANKISAALLKESEDLKEEVERRIDQANEASAHTTMTIAENLELRTERDALAKRCEVMEWLAEVQALKMHRIIRAGEWAQNNAGPSVREAWKRRENSNHELQATMKAALAATEGNHG